MSATLEAARRSAVTLEIRAPAVSDKTFIYTQGVPSTQWIVRHTLNKYPSVTVVDSAGSVVIGEIQYLSTSEIRLSFEHPFSGKAYLN